MHEFIAVVRNLCENVKSVSAVVEEVRVVNKGIINEPSLPMSVCTESNLPETVSSKKENVSEFEVVLSKKRNIAMLDEVVSTEFVNQVISETIASIANLPRSGDVDKSAFDENMQSAVVCEFIQSGEKNVSSLLKSSMVAHLEVDPHVVDTMRGKDQEGNAAKAAEHASSTKIREDAPSPTHADEVAHLGIDDDGEDEDGRNNRCRKRCSFYSSGI